MPSFKDFYDRFTATHADPEVRRLTASVGILDFAVASISLFEPIYLTTLGLTLPHVLLFYALVYLLYFFLLPLGARLSGRWGFHHAILYSSPFLIAYYLLLLAAKGDAWFLLLAAPVYALQKTLYWPSFHQELAKFGHDEERGREISNLASVSFLGAILGPVFGGVMISAAGFAPLFSVVGVLILASNIPLMSLPDRRTRDGFGYLPALKRVFEPERRRDALSRFGYGEELIGLVVWPVFIFTALKGYAETGLLVSASLLVTMISILYIGRLADLQSRHALLRSGTFFTAAAWVARMFVASPLGVLGADVFHRVSRALLGIPYISITYADAKKRGLLESVIFFEMALALGKAGAALLGAAVLWLVPGGFAAVFALAAAFTLLYARIP